MSVLIKGMKMPVSCYECILGRAVDGCERWYGKEVSTTARPINCPLVEVPTPHGRLKDADALKASLVFAEKTAEWAVPALRAVLMVLDEMPTIIEAEDGYKKGGEEA